MLALTLMSSEPTFLNWFFVLFVFAVFWLLAK